MSGNDFTRILGRIRPRNRLDALGLALEVGSLLIFVLVILRAPSTDSPAFFPWMVLALATALPAFLGMFLRRRA